MTQNFGDILATGALSAIIALIVGWLFYSYASLDLRDRARELKSATDNVLTETKKLRHLNRLILLALQNSGLANIRFDEKGDIIGLNVRVELGEGELRFDSPYDEEAGAHAFDTASAISKPIGDDSDRDDRQS